MSNPMEANRIKLEELKKRRQARQAGHGNTVSEVDTSRSEAHSESKLSLQQSDEIHVAGALVETYDMEVQCVLETRSMDGRPAKEREEEEKEIDLLQPREQKKRKEGKDDGRRDDLREVHELNSEELSSVVKSKHFTDFFNRSSKFVEKMLDSGNSDMIELLLREGIKTKDKSGKDVLTHSVTFVDPNYTNNRVVTDLDWSPQISELFLASYSQNEEGSIKDQVGVALLWNPALKSRPEFYCFAQSAVTSAKFFPFSNSTVLGGCFNGQIVLWDIRTKAMPVQRSGIAPDAHKYPVNTLNVIGTQIANNIASFSNDGILCTWDVKQFSKPIKSIRLTATQPTRAAKLTKAGSVLSTALASKTPLKPGEAPTMPVTIEKTAKEEAYDINVICGKFPSGDANNYFVGSLNGALYKNALHNKSSEQITMYDEHNGPISSCSINYPSEYDGLNGLVLTSSFDWTAKLWSPASLNSLATFENAEDFIYDVAWNPGNPSLFATANNEGYVDIFDLTRDFELPVAHEKVNNYAQNKLVWNTQGTALVSGDSQGALNLYLLGEKYRRVDNAKYDDFHRAFFQNRDEN